MPMIPDRFDQVETFRRWWKDVAEYCERRQEYTDCGIVFKTIRGYLNPRENMDEIEKLLTVATSRVPQRLALGTTTPSAFSAP